MLKTLAQIVCSSLTVALLIPTGGLFAKELPIVREITLLMPLKEFTVVEFPFEIKAHDFTPFITTDKSTPSLSLPALPPLGSGDQTKFAPPTLNDANKMANGEMPSSAAKQGSPSNTQSNGSSSPKPVDWSKGKNFFKFYPKKIGETQLIVFGYEKFPIVLNLKVTQNKEDVADSIYRFIDYEKNKEVATKFESTYHDKVVVNLTKALYNNEPPKGYEIISLQKEYISNPLRFRLIKEYQGKTYSGVEYLVINEGTTNITLDWEMFKNQKGIYGVTFNKDILLPNENARLFIIKQRGNDE